MIKVSTPLIYRACFDFLIKYYTFISALYFAHEQCYPSFISGNELQFLSTAAIVGQAQLETTILIIIKFDCINITINCK